MKRKAPRREDVILLKDLTPDKEVKGGSGKRLFGEPINGRRVPQTPASRKAGRPGGSKARKGR